MTSLKDLGRNLKDARDAVENETVKIEQGRSDGSWLPELRERHQSASAAFHSGWAKHNGMAAAA
jgi:hypothetical protein